MDLSDSIVDCRIIPVNDLLSLVPIVLLHLLFQIRNSLLLRDNTGQSEKGSLHDHINPFSQPQLFPQLRRIDRIETNLLLKNLFLHRHRKMRTQLRIIPDTVQKKNPIILDPFQQIITAHISLIVTGDIIRMVDQIR